jgi:hypothetical protein
MGDLEHRQPQDDFTIEIADINELGETVADSDSGTPSAAQPPTAGLEPRFSPRQRRRQLIITSAIVVLAFLVILGSTASVRELVSGVFIRPAPTPVPTLAPGVDLFYVQGSPPWGHLSIDGHPIARLPNIGVNPPLRLSRGQHTLVWQAKPFQAQSCTLSVPARYDTDSCVNKETVQVSGLLASIISFSVSLATLPGEQRTALIQAARAVIDTLQSTDTLRPGELYALSPQDPECKPSRPEPLCYATAKQPLKATLSLLLDTDAATNESCAGPQPGCTFLYQNCHLFCTGSEPASPATQEWDVFAPARVAWDFATLDGRVLVRDVPDNSFWDYATGQINDEFLMPLRIMWDSLEWHVTVPSDASVRNTAFLNPACAATQQRVQLLQPPVGASGSPVYPQWQFASGPLPAAGCLAVGTPQQNAFTTTAPSTSPHLVAYCLHRFGVLLAANDTAHRFWPDLPMPDAYEQRLAQQLAALIRGSSS